MVAADNNNSSYPNSKCLRLQSQYSSSSKRERSSIRSGYILQTYYTQFHSSDRVEYSFQLHPTNTLQSAMFQNSDWLHTHEFHPGLSGNPENPLQVAAEVSWNLFAKWKNSRA